MARRRRTLEWEGDRRDLNVDSLFSAMRDKAAHELGRDDISIGSEVDAHCAGLPLPSLAARYLLQSTVLPLSRIIHITGEEGSCKSALLFEIMRWHHVYGGGSVLIENENKDSPEMRQAILQRNPVYLRRHEIIPTHALEDWQEALTRFVRIAVAQQDAENGPGRTVPICFGIDSLMATAPRETLEKIQQEGFASRSHPLAANLISIFMRTMPSLLRNYPFTVVGTNHLKPSTDFQGRPTAQIPGGKSVKFMETYEIEMHRAPTPDIDRAGEGGLRLRIVTRKNSLGPSRKQILVELLWCYREAADGVVRQFAGWDWPTASIEMLLAFDQAKGKKTLYQQLMDIVPLRVESKTARRVSCPVLGFTKEEPGTYREVGQALEQRPDLLERLYPLLGITTYAAFQPGVDYRQALAGSEEAARQQAVMLYGDLGSLPLLDADRLDPQGTVLPPDEADAAEE